MQLYIALVALAGTALLMSTSLQDLRAARAPALEWWNTEDELIREIPRWRRLERRRLKRDLLGMREPGLNEEIRHISQVLAGWVLLFIGSASTAVDALLSP